MIDTVIFDFDGTLVDSAPAILEGFRAVLAKHGITAAVPIDENLIGPPLKATLVKLTRIDDRTLLSAMVEDFKDYYDTQGYLTTQPYTGAATLLSSLGQNKLQLFIATNKREKPTRLLLEHLQWTSHFKGVYCLDSTQPAAADKGELLALLLKEEGQASETAIYVGDTLGDEQAATENCLRFYRASWGYGIWPQNESSAILHKLSDLCDVLKIKQP